MIAISKHSSPNLATVRAIPSTTIELFSTIERARFCVMQHGRASPLIAFKSCRMIGRRGAPQAEETGVCFAIYLLSFCLRIAYEEKLLVYADYSCCCQLFIFQT